MMRTATRPLPVAAARIALTSSRASMPDRCETDGCVQESGSCGSRSHAAGRRDLDRHLVADPQNEGARILQAPGDVGNHDLSGGSRALAIDVDLQRDGYGMRLPMQHHAAMERYG